LLLGVFVYFTGKLTNPMRLSVHTWIFLGLSGLATAASWVCFYRALKIGDAAKVLVIDKFSIVLVTIFALIFLGEKVLLKDWLGVCFVSIGLILIAMKV